MTEILLPSGAPVGVEPAPELRTFLFADVRGYTRFTQERGDAAAVQLVSKFARIMRDGVRARGGQVVEVVGDEALAVFGSARQALRTAVELQARFARETEQDPTLPLPVGIGLDAGEAVPLEGGYRGEALNVASRLCNLALPGEVLASEGVVYLGRRVPGVSYTERGIVPLKGFVEPIRVIRVVRSGEGGGHENAPGRALTARASALPPEPELPIGGFLGALPAGVLVGRDQEWNQIMEALDDVAKGSGRLVLLAGEPGIGKTRLAQEVTVKAQHWGFLVATGRCYEQEQSIPYYPFLEALAAVYERCAPGLQAEIPRRWPHLGRLLPDQVGAPISRPGEPGLEQEDQLRLFRAVTQLLEAVAVASPVALLLDDLHWADDSSLKLLQHLARYTHGSRVFVLGTYRDVEVHRQHPLESALLDLSREGLLYEIEVSRLGLDGTSALMAEIMGEKDLEELAGLVHRRTAGNAFFIQEMLRALVERGDLYRTEDGKWEQRRIREMEVPKSIRSVIGQRLGRLEEEAQEILREASVFGQEFSFDDLLALAQLAPSPSGPRAGGGFTEDAIDSSLGQAILAGLVRETKPEHYAFNHALTQQALYAELSTRRRKRLHLAVGASLERLSPQARKRRAGELEWHFLEGDDAERALPYALLAGDQAEEVFANGDAQRHYRTALELAQELCDAPREVEAMRKLAGVLTIDARYDEALDLLERGTRVCVEALDPEGESLLVAEMGHLHLLRGTPEEGIARLLPLINAQGENGERTPTRGLAALWTALARLYMKTQDLETRLAVAERAVELADAVSDTPLLVNAEVTRASALWDLGRDEEALQALDGAIHRAEEAGDLVNLARALDHTGMYYARRGDLDKDRLFHERALSVAEQRGDRGQIVVSAMVLSTNAFLVGNWQEAESYVDRAESVTRELGMTPLSLWPASARAWLALRRGDLGSAERQARDILQLAERSKGAWLRQSYRLLAEIELLRGRPEVAERYIASALDEAGWTEDPAFLATLAWVRVATGDVDGALKPARTAVEEAELHRYNDDLAGALTVLGRALCVRAEWQDAGAAFARAEALARRLPLVFDEGRALHAHGLMEIEHGDRKLGHQLLQQALGIFERLGAEADEELVRTALSTLIEFS